MIQDDDSIECFDPKSSRAFAYARNAATACLGWIWVRWLQGADAKEITGMVDSFVQRSLQLIKVCDSREQRPLHDLFLIHVAILGGSRGRCAAAASKLTDARVAVWANDGDRLAAAWVGMLKYRLLGDPAEMRKQAEIMKASARPLNCRVPTLSMRTAWMDGAWGKFAKQQGVVFQKLWDLKRRCREVLKESESETIVSIGETNIRADWCWAENALAVTAHWEGAQVNTDPLWFPPNAVAGQS